MNEQIKKLIEEATTIEYGVDNGFDRVTFDKQKFAELIVKECIGKCEFVANMATVTNDGEMARKTKATADSCATMIKQHFGVEE